MWIGYTWKHGLILFHLPPPDHHRNIPPTYQDPYILRANILSTSPAQNLPRSRALVHATLAMLRHSLDNNRWHRQRLGWVFGRGPQVKGSTAVHCRGWSGPVRFQVHGRCRCFKLPGFFCCLANVLSNPSERYLLQQETRCKMESALCCH